MQISEIQIIAGQPDFEFEPIRQLEVKCEATNALMPAPTIDEANGRLRALASKVGATAVINVDYSSGVSFTSWKSLKATGLAVRAISDVRACPYCAEPIKRAAVKCRFCGSDVEPEAVAIPPASGGAVAAAGLPLHSEPLKDNNNPALIIGLVVLAFVILSAILAAAK